MAIDGHAPRQQGAARLMRGDARRRALRSAAAAVAPMPQNSTLRGGGSSRALARRAFRLPLIALLLAALVAAVLAASRPAAVAVAQAPTAGSEEVWSATVTVHDFGGNVRGCDDSSAVPARHCSRLLTDNTIRIGSTTHRVTSVFWDLDGVAIWAEPEFPSRIKGTWELTVGGPFGKLDGFGNRIFDRRTYVVDIWSNGEIRIYSATNQVSEWRGGQSIELALYRTYGDQVPEDLRKSASRSGRCGAPEDGLSPDSDEAGYWHCHGDSIYHRHAGTWRGSHQPGGDPPEPPGLRPEPRPPNQKERDRGFADNWNGGWHWHDDGNGNTMYHIHRSPH